MKKKYFSYDDFSYNICSDRHCVKSSKYFYLASLCKIAHICYLYNVRTTYIYSLISYNVCKISICEYSLFCILNPDFFFSCTNDAPILFLWHNSESDCVFESVQVHLMPHRSSLFKIQFLVFTVSSSLYFLFRASYFHIYTCISKNWFFSALTRNLFV